MGKSYALNDKEIKSLISSSVNVRFEYFVKRVVDWGDVWTIKNKDGFVLFGDDKGNQCIPVWPFKEYAALLCVDEWKDAQPTSISIDDFIGKWIPGMQQDSRIVAVFPTPIGNSAVISPAELEVELKKLISEIE